jgi:hypothetical protein
MQNSEEHIWEMCALIVRIIHLSNTFNPCFSRYVLKNILIWQRCRFLMLFMSDLLHTQFVRKIF